MPRNQHAGPHRAGVGDDLPGFLVSLLANFGTIRARRETAMLSPEIIAICAALVFTVVLSTSIAWLWIGLRGRLIDTHPRCRRCGYDLTGHACRPELCAECGSRLLVVGAVKLGHRKPRPAFLGGGGLMLVIAGVGLAAMATQADPSPAAKPAVLAVAAPAGAVRPRQAALPMAPAVSARRAGSVGAAYGAALVEPIHTMAARPQPRADEQVGSGIDVVAATYVDARWVESEPAQHLDDALAGLRELGGSAVSLNSFDPPPFTPVTEALAPESWSIPSTGGGFGGPSRLKVMGSNPLGGPMAAPGLLNVSDPTSTARKAERVNEAISTRIDADGAHNYRNGSGKSRRGRGAPRNRSGLRK